MNLKKLIALILALIMLVGSIAGCGTSTSTDTKQESTVQQAAQTSQTETEKEKEPLKISMFVDSTMAPGGSYDQGISAFEQETGIRVERNIIAGANEDAGKKTSIALLSGDTTDCFRYDNPIGLDDYAKNGIIMELNDLAKEAGYDLESKYGKYLMKTDGKIYSIPFHVTFWTVFYNKNLFDSAGVPYPKGKWTWDDYIAAAKKLTNPEEKIYGSYMLDYDNYSYILANQKNVSAYKADGTSNYDDPAFKESLQFFKDLGDVHKIQPSYLEFKTKKLAWDGFMSGKYAMHFISTWYFALFTDPKTYPKDFKVGIVQTPVPADGSGDTNFGNPGFMVINKNAAHPKEAFKFVTWMGENMYKYNKDFPARQDLSREDWSAIYKDIAEKTGNELTEDDIYKALVDNGLGFASEKILGPIASQYTNTILKEADLYYVGQQSLEDTVKNIKARADEEIAKLEK